MSSAQKPETIIHLLQGRGHRMTTVRRFMITALCKAEAPLAANDLLEQLAKDNLHANKTTVYRELSFLEKQSAIKSIDFGDGTKRYEVAGGHHHHHLICTDCGSVTDIELKNDVEEEGVRLGGEHGFTVTGHSLEFFGTCKKCS
jgi:Fur family ferric uptake transcriptional regulator